MQPLRDRKRRLNGIEQLESKYLLTPAGEVVLTLVVAFKFLTSVPVRRRITYTVLVHRKTQTKKKKKKKKETVILEWITTRFSRIAKTENAEMCTKF